MKKTVRIATIVVVVLIAVLLAAPTLLRGKIERIVRREADAALVAKLDFARLDISLLRHFPNASLELKGLTLTGADAFAGDTIVAARRISVVVAPLSLLGDEGLVVKKILFDAPAVHARKTADGAVNWDVVKPSQEPEESPEEASQGDDPSSFRLAVRDFRIVDAAIRYEDDSTKVAFATAPLSLRLRGDLSAGRSDLDLHLEAEGVRFVSGGIPMLRDVEAELKASIEADPQRGRYAFAENTLRLNAVEVGLDGWIETGDGVVKMDLTAGCDAVKFRELLSLVPAFYTREFRNLTATGELAMSLWARGELRDATVPAFGLDVAVTDGGFRYASLPKSVTDIEVALSVTNPGGSLDATVVDLSRFGMKMADNAVSATFRAANLVSDPAFRASVAGRVDLGSVREVYPLEKGVELGGLVTADLKAEGRMSDIDKGRYERMKASGTCIVEGVGLSVAGLPDLRIRRMAATVTPAALTLGEFGATAGRSDLSATGRLTGYLGYLLRGAPLSGRLYVKSDLLDLNELLAMLPASEDADSGADPEQKAAPSPAGEAAAPEIPRNLDLAFKADLHKVLLQGMTIDDFTGEIRAADGALTLQRLAMGLFGGKVAASGRYATAADPQRPALDLKAEFAGASFRRTFEELDMVRKLVPIFAETGGDYSLSLDLRTRLDATMAPDLRTLDASGEIRSANIRVERIAALDALAKALGDDALRRIEAKDVAIRFTVREGRLATQPFDLKMGAVAMNLAGSTGLDGTIDYQAKVSLPAAATGGVLQRIGVRIGGTFAAPKITLGVREAAEEAVKNIVDREIEKLTGSESLAAEVEKQAERLRAEARRAGEKLVAAAEEQRAGLVEAAAAKGALAKIAAEKAGDKLVSEARKLADKLATEAERQIGKLAAKEAE